MSLSHETLERLGVLNKKLSILNSSQLITLADLNNLFGELNSLVEDICVELNVEDSTNLFANTNFTSIDM